MAPQNDLLTKHEYDGIQEYDNPAPGWWSWMFFASFVFSIFYLIIYLIGGSVTGVEASYQRSVTAELLKQYAELGELTADEPTLRRFVTDPQDAKWLVAGEAVFRANCISCHGSGGVGISGPNLTDDQYIHVKQAVDIITVIQDGAKNGAMPAWRNKLQPNDLILVSAYVASLRGQNKPGREFPGDKTIPPFFTDE